MSKKVTRRTNHGRTEKAAVRVRWTEDTHEGNGANQLHRSPIHLMHRAEQSAQELFSAELKISGLTARQLAVLVTVSENEGLSQTGIRDRTGINQATITDIVRRMERKTLLQRHRLREDARAYSVTLTNEGQRVLSTAEPLARKVDERILDALPAKRREPFITALLTIVHTLEGRRRLASERD